MLKIKSKASIQKNIDNLFENIPNILNFISNFEYDIIFENEIYKSNIELFISDFNVFKKWFINDVFSFNHDTLQYIFNSIYQLFNNKNLNGSKYNELMEDMKDDIKDLKKEINNYKKKISTLKNKIKKNKLSKCKSDQVETSQLEKNIYEFENEITSEINTFFNVSMSKIKDITDYPHLVDNIFNRNNIPNCIKIFTYFYEFILYRKELYRLSNFFLNVKNNFSLIINDCKQIYKLNIENRINNLLKKFKATDYDMEIDRIISFFNNNFFDYIKIKKIKLLDFIINNNDFYIQIFHNNEIIKNSNELSDGEYNALNIISFL